MKNFDVINLGGNLFPTLFHFARELDSQKEFGLQAFRTIKTDIVENENNYVLSSELPGVNKDNLNVKFEDEILSISVQQDTSNEKTDESGKVIMQERSTKNQSRSFRFQNVDADNISANFENGILTLTLNKKVKENSKQIEIK